jgi:hypothetical protein
MLTVTYAECHTKAPYAECHYAECRYAECRRVNIILCFIFRLKIKMMKGFLKIYGRAPNLPFLLTAVVHNVIKLFLL